MEAAFLVVAVFAVGVFGYQAYWLNVVLKRLLREREDRARLLVQLRERTQEAREQTQASLARTHRFQEESRADSQAFRADAALRADAHVARIETLIRLQGEQVALLTEIAGRLRAGAAEVGRG